jgi:MFS family permease
MAVAAVLIGAGFGVFGLLTTLWGYIAGVVVFTIGEILQAGVSPTVVSDLAPVRLRGTYQGVFHMAWGLASMVGPWGAGLIMQARGAPALWAACLAVGMAGAAGHLLIAGARRRRLVELRAAAVPVSAVED